MVTVQQVVSRNCLKKKNVHGNQDIHKDIFLLSLYVNVSRELMKVVRKPHANIPFGHFYPTALKDRLHIFFTDGVRTGGWAGGGISLSDLYLRNLKV